MTANELLSTVVYPALDAQNKAIREQIAYVKENGKEMAEKRLDALFDTMMAKIEACEQFKAAWSQALLENDWPEIDILSAASTEIGSQMKAITELNDELRELIN